MPSDLSKLPPHVADIVRDFRYKMEREREEQQTKLRAAHDHFIA